MVSCNVLNNNASEAFYLQIALHKSPLTAKITVAEQHYVLVHI